MWSHLLQKYASATIAQLAPTPSTRTSLVRLAHAKCQIINRSLKKRALWNRQLASNQQCILLSLTESAGLLFSGSDQCCCYRTFDLLSTNMALA